MHQNLIETLDVLNRRDMGPTGLSNEVQKTEINARNLVGRTPLEKILLLCAHCPLYHRPTWNSRDISSSPPLVRDSPPLRAPSWL